ncbi:MAG: hypothetical protein AB7F86_13145 [Bdellovibrionales bacterium]
MRTQIRAGCFVLLSLLAFVSATSSALSETEKKALHDHVVFKSKLSADIDRDRDIELLRQDVRAAEEKLNLKIKSINADLARLKYTKEVWTKIKHNPYLVAKKWLQKIRQSIQADCCRIFKDRDFARDRLHFIERRASERKLRVLQNSNMNLDDG